METEYTPLRVILISVKKLGIIKISLPLDHLVVSTLQLSELWFSEMLCVDQQKSPSQLKSHFLHLQPNLWKKGSVLKVKRRYFAYAALHSKALISNAISSLVTWRSSQAHLIFKTFRPLPWSWGGRAWSEGWGGSSKAKPESRVKFYQHWGSFALVRYMLPSSLGFQASFTLFLSLLRSFSYLPQEFLIFPNGLLSRNSPINPFTILSKENTRLHFRQVLFEFSSGKMTLLLSHMQIAQDAFVLHHAAWSYPPCFLKSFHTIPVQEIIELGILFYRGKIEEAAV